MPNKYPPICLLLLILSFIILHSAFINDIDYLNTINKILDNSYPGKQIYHLNKNQKACIEIGRRQIDDGDSICNEKLEKEEDKWLNE